MQFQVYRTSASSYQDSKFLSNEKKILESLEGVEYIQSLKDYKPGSKLILISNTHTDPKVIPHNILEQTSLLVHPNSGFDNLTQEFRSQVNFPIIIGNPIRANAVSEYILSALFQHFTTIPTHYHWHPERSFPRKLIRDQKILILGYGHIGKLVATALQPLCPNLVIFDPNMSEQHLPYKVLNSWDDQILAEKSCLIVAASLNPTSHGMINESNISKLAADCLIINPARGEIIKQDSLLTFLNKNPESFAFLDVFDQEPFPPGLGHDLKNLNKTSHIAGVYSKLKSDMISFELLVIKDFIQRYQQNNMDEFKAEYSECILPSP
jgi:D-3-phosphoglycerate dehydrogenase